MHAVRSATTRSISAFGNRSCSAPFTHKLFITNSPARNMSANAIKDVTPQEALELIQGGNKKYLDVRTVEEFTAGHAPGAVNIPVMLRGAAGMSPNPEFLSKVAQTFPDPAETIVVGCKSGARSMNAATIMSSQAGFQDLLNVKGGFDAWSASGLPVEKEGNTAGQLTECLYSASLLHHYFDTVAERSG